MGHKVNPIGFRLGIIRDWQAKWYTEKHYADFLLEDVKLREKIRSEYREAAISLVEIDRQMKDIALTIHTARPGIVIGRGGQRVDEMRLYLENFIGKKIRLNILEIRQPELDAYLVARSIAEQIERRIAYRRAMKQAIFRTIQAGAKGMKVSCAGRLGNAEIARRQTMHQGQVPLHTLRADIDYGFTEAHTTLGRIGIKVWIYKGEILPEHKEMETAEVPSEAVAAETTDQESGTATELLRESIELVPETTAEEEPTPEREEKQAKPAAKASDEKNPAAKERRKTTRATTKTAERKTSAKAESKTAKTTTEKRKKATTASKAKKTATKPISKTTQEAELSTSTEEEESDAAT